VNGLLAGPPVTLEKNGLAAVSLHVSSKIVRDPTETLSKRFRYDAEVDAARRE
jgi:hypothetical protein